MKTASTPMKPNKALVKDEEADSLWYPRDLPFNLEAFSDSDYAGASLDRKSTTRGCQFLGKRLISWQCKKQTIVLWIQNQMLDYGFNFMNTKIYIDNESTICIMKNLVFHSKTKHIEIRHHFIRDCYEKKLIQVIKIHTDHNVADLLTKAFDVSSTAGLSLYCWMKLGTKVDAARFNLKFVDQHNMVACLEKTEENAEFHQIVDFLSTCSINYALTVSPTIYASYIEQFWKTATSKTVNSVKQIQAIVDGKAVVISESSVRSDLLFNDEDGIACLTNDEIFENLALMGYEQLSTKLTFQKGSFSPQWKFLIHAILHYISSKSTAWNEFSTNLASAVICLAKGQKFNFSKLIFDGMLSNLDPKRFLMYPRFLQLFLNNQLKDLPEPFNDTYETPTHSKKVFSNMARKSKKNSGKFTSLFDSMLVQKQAPEGEVSHELQTEAHIDQILPSPSTYQRKQRKTQNLRRAKKVTELPQTSVPLDHGADEVLDLEKEKDAQVVEILKLKQRVKKLERKRKSSISHPRRRIYMQTVYTATTRVSVVSAPVTTTGVAISTVEPRTPPTTAATAFIYEDLTIAQTLIKMKEEKAKEKGVAIKDLAELDRAQKERQKQEEATSAALAEEFDEIQTRIDVDHELAVRLTHEEQEKYTIEERAKLLAEFFERRKK
ncbi:hypothetical protein Tco_1141508 [Tanacetum coccineum]